MKWFLMILILLSCPFTLWGQNTKQNGNINSLPPIDLSQVKVRIVNAFVMVPQLGEEPVLVCQILNLAGNSTARVQLSGEMINAAGHVIGQGRSFMRALSSDEEMMSTPMFFVLPRDPQSREVPKPLLLNEPGTYTVRLLAKAYDLTVRSENPPRTCDSLTMSFVVDPKDAPPATVTPLATPRPGAPREADAPALPSPWPLKIKNIMSNPILGKGTTGWFMIDNDSGQDFKVPAGCSTFWTVSLYDEHGTPVFRYRQKAYVSFAAKRESLYSWESTGLMEVVSRGLNRPLTWNFRRLGRYRIELGLYMQRGSETFVIDHVVQEVEVKEAKILKLSPASVDAKPVESKPNSPVDSKPQEVPESLAASYDPTQLQLTLEQLEIVQAQVGQTLKGQVVLRNKGPDFRIPKANGKSYESGYSVSLSIYSEKGELLNISKLPCSGRALPANGTEKVVWNVYHAMSLQPYGPVSIFVIPEPGQYRLVFRITADGEDRPRTVHRMEQTITVK